MANVSSSNGLEKRPKLRFLGFDEPWRAEKLSDFAERVTRKNSNNETDLPLTISSKDGLVDQISYFNKTVASKDMSGYYLLRNGEYAYNKSYSVGYDFGSIKRLDRYPMGALSTLYICFALKKHDTDFIKVYFDSLKWYKEIYMISAEGARNHGLLNIPTDEFFATKHYLPENTAEQRKIADFLIALDRRIDAQRSLVDNLKKYKRGLLREVFDKSIQSTDYHGGYWAEAKLGEICTYRRGSFPQPYGLPEWYDEEKGMPFIQVADVNDNMTINANTNRHISDIAKNHSVFVPKGTLIVTLQGTIGRVAITSYDAYIDRTLLVIQNISDCVLKEFLMYAIYMKFDVEKQTADGSIIKTITKETLTEFLINIPPIHEQQRIVSLLRLFDQRIENSKVALEDLCKMRSSLLQQLFI